MWRYGSVMQLSALGRHNSPNLFAIPVSRTCVLSSNSPTCVVHVDTRPLELSILIISYAHASLL